MSRFWRIIDAFFLGMLSFLQASHSTCTHRPAESPAHFEGENGPFQPLRTGLHSDTVLLNSYGNTSQVSAPRKTEEGARCPFQKWYP